METDRKNDISGTQNDGDASALAKRRESVEVQKVVSITEQQGFTLWMLEAVDEYEKHCQVENLERADLP